MVELFAGLDIEILAVDNEQAFVDVVVGLEECRCLERGERLARAGRVPDVAVATVLLNAIHNRLDRVNLVRAHHEELGLACDENHVLADHLAKRALGEELIGEVVEVGNLGVVLGREPANRKKPLISVEGEVPCIVVGEVPSVRAIVADDKKLNEAEKRVCVSVAGVVLVFDDLLHRLLRADPKCLQLDLNDGNAVDQEDDVVAVIAAVRIDAGLIDDLKCVLAPVLDVDERVVERRSVVADECFPVPEGACGFVHVGCDDLIEESLELAVGECDTIQGFELFPEVCFKRCSIADAGAIFVLEVP